MRTASTTRPRASVPFFVSPDVTERAVCPPVLAGVQASWEKLRKRAKVLLVLDVSGSMGEQVGSEGTSKLDLAKRAAASAG